MKRYAEVCRVAAVVLAFAGAAAAAPAWERQLDMKSMAESARVIGEMFGGKRPYSRGEFKEAAENIQSHAGKRIVEDFEGPPQPDSKVDSATIASSSAEFGKLAGALEIYAGALSSAADRNPDGLGPDTRMGGTLLGSPFGRKAHAARDAASMPAEHAYHLMLQTCTSCHAKFRRP